MLNLLREFVCAVARHLGFGDDQVMEIEICVDEACANAIEHAFVRRTPAPGLHPGLAAGPDSPEGEVALEIAFTGEELTIRVVDNGTGSHPTLGGDVMRLEEYLDQNREKYRGLGFQLMRRFMDRVSVTTDPGRGTTVEMTKIRRQ